MRPDTVALAIAREIYGDKGVSESASDPAKLRAVADMLDRIDDIVEPGVGAQTERLMQADLRRIATQLEAADDERRYCTWCQDDPLHAGPHNDWDN